MRTKLLWLGLLGLFSCFVHGQTVINTNHPNNNGNGSVTFNVQNTNAYDIIITGIQCHLGTTTTNNIQLLYNTSPYVDTTPPWSFGTVGDGQNGWVSAGTGVIANSDTANGIVPVLSSLSLTIPAGATYQLGLSATTMQYSTLTSGAGINTFSAGGVNLTTGDGISWGGTVYPSTPANYPRGLIGGITFIPAMHFAVSAPATATAGTAFNFTVTALDELNNTMTGYTGTVHFTSADGASVLPADATLTNGVGTFSATLKTAGNQTITATDTTTPAIAGTSGSIAVSASAVVQFAVSAPATATAGTAFNFTVTAQDAFNNTVTGYTGTAHFTSTDGAAVLPADAALTNGAGTFSATLTTAGTQTISATDTDTPSITGTSDTITVSASTTATQFAVSAPATATATTAFNFTVTALDAFNNTVTSYTGTAHFTSTDGAAVLPADATLTSGSGTFSATLNSAGSQTITATDTVTGSITGTSNPIAVSKKSTTIALSATPSNVLVGQSTTLTATVAGDPPTGTVTFSDDGTTLSCSPVTLIVGATNSTAACTATFATAGTHGITAVYSGDANFATTSSFILPVTVSPAAATAAEPAPMLDRWAALLLCGLFGAVALARLRRI